MTIILVVAARAKQLPRNEVSLEIAIFVTIMGMSSDDWPYKIRFEVAFFLYHEDTKRIWSLSLSYLCGCNAFVWETLPSKSHGTSLNESFNALLCC